MDLVSEDISAVTNDSKASRRMSRIHTHAVAVNDRHLGRIGQLYSSMG